MKELLWISKTKHGLRLLIITVLVSIFMTSAYDISAETSVQKSDGQVTPEKATDSAFFDKNIKTKSKKVSTIKEELPSELPVVKNPEKEHDKWEIAYWWDKANWPAQPCYSEGVAVWLCSPQWITARSFIEAKNQMKMAAKANEGWKASISELWEKNVTFGGYFSYRPSRDLQQMKNLEWSVFLLMEDGKRIPAKSVVIDFANAVYYPGSYQGGQIIAGVYVPGVNEEGYYYVPCSFTFDKTDDKGNTILNSKTKSINLCLGSSLCQVRLEWQFKK